MLYVQRFGCATAAARAARARVLGRELDEGPVRRLRLRILAGAQQGVAQVQVFGQQKYAVRVQVDPNQLASRLDDLAAALSRIHAADLKSGAVEYLGTIA